ncbi:GLUG motif-containing protein [Paenibacillus camelliae]|uniref:GLUG motif-containing protein n=1 Tax=Paenibacillus camelliae TaxID=512410 RepID=UPI00203CEBBF|nr:GLUG motif-containing protein [Paenibacillus camelliae]MCM3633399.1 InlB B-repeat-containing protein [Paenibacillus camelliae]
MSRLITRRWVSMLTIAAIVFTTVMGNIGLYSVQANEVVSTDSGPFAGGSGTPEDPWLIATAEQLDEVRHYQDKNFKLVNDIDLSSYGDGSWVPIDRYNGTLDGDNHHITGLYVRGQDGGLFNRLDGFARVTRLNLEVDIDVPMNSGGITYLLDGEILESSVTGSVKGSNYSGGLAARMSENARIVDSYSEANVRGGRGGTGGLVGLALGTAQIINSNSSGAVSGIGIAGGLVGSGGGNITNSYSTSSVYVESTSGYAHAGGLVGSAYQYYEAIISNSYFLGTVESAGAAGGLIGYISSGRCLVENSYSKGAIKGYTKVGGLIGESVPMCAIDNSFSSGIVSGDFDYIGGLIGLSRDAVITNSYSVTQVSGQGYVGGLIGMNFDADGGRIENSYSAAQINGTWHLGSILAYNNDSGTGDSKLIIENTYWDKDKTHTSSMYGGIGVSTEATKMKSTFSNWNFDTTWAIEENISTPYLKSIDMNVQKLEAPFIIHAEVKLEDREHLYLTFNDQVDISSLKGLIIKRNGETLQTIEAININGSEWKISLASPILFTDSVTFSYQSEKGSISDVRQNKMLSVNNLQVENNNEYAGSGTQEDPWEIATPSQLSGIRFMNISDQSYFKLVADIDLTSYLQSGGVGYNDGKGWTSIPQFNGHFDGTGHSITGLYMRGEQGGLFQQLGESSTVRDVKLINTDIEVLGRGGAVASIAQGTIENIHVTGNIQGSQHVGGLVGQLDGGTIRNSYNQAKVTGTEHVGGLAGTAVNESRISEAFSNGSVTGEHAIGGLLGSGEDAEVINSYNIGKVTGEELVGGLVGFLGANASIRSSFNAGNMSSSPSAGGIIGGKDGQQAGLVENSYWDIRRSEVAQSSDGVGVQTTPMKQSLMYTDWDFDQIWAIEEGESYPYLQGIDHSVQPDIASPILIDAFIGPSDRSKLTMLFDEPITIVRWTNDYNLLTGQGVTIRLDDLTSIDSKTMVFDLSEPINIKDTVKFSYVNTMYFQDKAGNSLASIDGEPVDNQLILDDFFDGGSGTLDDPIRIATPEQLDLIRSYGDTTDVYFELTNDIDLTEYLSEGGKGFNADGWLPIPQFNGTLDGAGFAIKGLQMSNRYGGLFVTLDEQAMIKNLTLLDVSLEKANDTGAMAAFVKGTIENSTVSGSITNEAGYVLGGFTGQLLGNGQIVNSHSDVHIKGIWHLGGIAGSVQDNSKISNSSSEGSVEGTSSLGGIAGRVIGAARVGIENSTSSASISGETNIGGLVGVLEAVDMVGSSSTGDVTGTSYIGGLVGFGNGCSIQNSFYEGTVSGDQRIGGIGGYLQYGCVIDSSFSKGQVNGNSMVGGLVGNANRDTTIVNSYSEAVVEGQTQLGGLAGYYERSVIRDSYKKGPVNGEAELGGLIGTMQDGQIINSFTEGSVTGLYYVGGLVGSGSGMVEDSYSSMSLTGKENVGGLYGQYTWGTISGSYSEGSITGESNVGGLIGLGSNGGTNIKDSYSVANVSGVDYVGGLAGYYEGKVANSYSLAKVEGITHTGIIIGGRGVQGVAITDSYWNIDQTTLGSSFGGQGMGTTALKQRSTFANWNFDSIWNIDQGAMYPFLRRIDLAKQKDIAPPTVISAQIPVQERDRMILTFDEPAYAVDEEGFTVANKGSSIAVTGIINHNEDRTEWIVQLDQSISLPETKLHTVKLGYQAEEGAIADAAGNGMTSFTNMTVIDLWLEQEFAGGSGSKEDPWLILFPEHVSNIRNYEDQEGIYFKLAANIDLADYIASGEAGAYGWSSIPSFSGHLDGAGYEISGLSGEQGLFDTVEAGATITNLAVVNVNLDSYQSNGSFAKTLYGTIQDSFVSGSINVESSSGMVGGFVANLKGSGRIERSENHATVQGGRNAGGIAGNVEDEGAIASSYNAGEIISSTIAGGLAGSITGLPRIAIEGSYNLANINSETYTGGLVGLLQDATIHNSYNEGVVAGRSFVGGLVGYSLNSCVVQGSYNEGTVTGQLTSIGGLAGASYACTFEQSYNSGAVTGDNQVGGLIGMAAGVGGATFIDTYNTAPVTGNRSVGGIAGAMFGGLLRNSYTSSSVSATTSTYIGALIGEGRELNMPVVESTYWNLDQYRGNSAYGGVGKTTKELKQQAMFKDWDFDSIWKIHDGRAYPYLQGQQFHEPLDTVEPYVLEANIRSNEPAQLLVAFDEEVQLTVDGFTLIVDGEAWSLLEAAATNNANVWLIRLAEPVAIEAQVTLTYDAAVGQVTDLAGNELLSFTEWPVTLTILSNDATVTAVGDAYSVLEEEQSIVSQQTDITTETTVLELLSELNKFEKAQWKVVASNTTIITTEQFDLAAEKQSADQLVIGDQLAVMAEDGTIVIYEIVVKPLYHVMFETNGGTPVNSQMVISEKLAAVPTAPIREGYRFEGWFTDNGTFADRFDLASEWITEDTLLYAKWIVENELVVSVTPVNSIVTGAETSYQYGDSVQLTAVPLEGYQFESWKDVATGKVLSTQLDYSFNITRDMSLIATSTKLEEEVYTVRFVSESGYVLSIQQIPRGGDATPPPNPSKPDAEFIGWSSDYTNIQQHVTFKPVYSEKVKQYTVTVNGGSIPSGETSYPFDAKVTVIADQPAEGTQFSHWESNLKTVSYNEAYTFYITGNTTLTAVYDSAPIVKSPIIMISPDVIANSLTLRMSFIGQYDMTSPFLFIETGVVVKKSDTPITELHFGTENAIKARSSAQTETGQFMMNKTGVQSGETWYARTYLIYMDASGEVHTIYSDIVSGTMP